MATKFEYNDDADFWYRTDDYQGQTFTPLVAHKITYLVLRLSGTGIGIVYVKATAGGVPTGGVLCQGSFSINTPIRIPIWKQVNLGAGADLSDGVMYSWYALTAQYCWFSAQPALYPRGTLVWSDNGVNWNIHAGADMKFEDWGEALPSVLNNYSGGFANAKRLTRMRGW